MTGTAPKSHAPCTKMKRGKLVVGTTSLKLLNSIYQIIYIQNVRSIKRESGRINKNKIAI